MHVLAILGFAVRSLQRAPIRSSLTSLGVVIGVAAVVATTGIGNGAQARIQYTLATAESRTVYVSAIAPTRDRQRDAASLPLSERLRPSDYYALRHEVSGAVASSPRIYLTARKALANGRFSAVTVEGIDVDGLITANRRLLQGAPFNKRDVAYASSVCIVSESLAVKLYGEERPIGRALRLNDSQFIVVGVIDDIPNTNPIFSNADMHVYVPFTSLLRRLDSTAQMMVSLQADSIDTLPRLQRDIDDVMEQNRSGRKARFHINNAVDSIKIYVDGSLVVARLLAVVAAVALVVGGIGIMNIMLVSVGERTREIGLRLAIGTRERDILYQFLAESVSLSVLGGGLGVLLGWITALLITAMNDWPTEMTLESVALAFLFSAAIGIVFGYQPARRAAELRPIQALRSE